MDKCPRWGWPNLSGVQESDGSVEEAVPVSGIFGSQGSVAPARGKGVKESVRDKWVAVYCSLCLSCSVAAPVLWQQSGLLPEVHSHFHSLYSFQL